MTVLMERSANLGQDEDRLAIIGLDGVRLDVIRQFKESLPYLSQMLSTGTVGDLRTVLPGPHSGSAWTSFSTGVNPGRHGIGDWRVREGYRFTPATSEDVPNYRFWDYLSDAGYTVGVFNIPLTSPIYPVNGVLVTSWADPQNNWAYPESFQEELSNIGYIQKPKFSSPDADLENLYESIERRREGFELFTSQYDWNLLLGMFYETEMAHHQFAPFLNPDHPEYNPEYREKVRSVYEKIDRELKTLDESLGDIPIIILSDHGFCPVYERIHLNRILEEKEFYSPSANNSEHGRLEGAIASLSHRVKDLVSKQKTLRNVAFRATSVPILGDKVNKMIDDYRSTTREKDVTADWTRTKAFNGYEHGGIFINRKELPSGIVPDNEVDDLVDDIIHALESHEYLSPRVKGIHRRENIFSGKRLEMLPEIIVDFKDGYLGSSGYEERFARGAVELRSEGKNVAFHTMDGILLASGNGICETKIEGANIMDIAPTVLRYFEQPIPDNFDGTPLVKMFEQAHSIHENTGTMLPSYRKSSATELTQSERQQVEKRLQEMGYQ